LKKFLYSTTALAVAGALTFGSDANAAAKPIVMGLGGFMNAEFGWADNQTSFENGVADGTLTSNKRSTFNTVQDSEIYFTGSSELDNGVTVSITVQLEADQAANAGSHIDESYMKLTGGFGDIRLGSTTGSNSVLKHVAPGVGPHPRLGGADNYISVPAAATRASNSTDASSSGDANKIVYISPVAGGLRIGVSFTPSNDSVNPSPVTGGNAAVDSEVFEAALSFETEVGTSSVKADVGFEHRDNATQALRGGINLGVGGVTLGGSILVRNDQDNARKSTATSLKGHAYDLGATYAMGAYTFGITRAFGSQVDATAAGQTADDEQSKWSAGVSYALDTGVTLTASHHYAKYTDGAVGADTDNNKGHALIGQINVSF